MRIGVLPALATGALLAACSGGDSPDGPARGPRLAIVVSAEQVDVDGSITVSARDSVSGRPIAASDVEWTFADIDKLRPTPAGDLHADNPGRARIRAALKSDPANADSVVVTIVQRYQAVIAAGVDHSCSVAASDGDLFCWGDPDLSGGGLTRSITPRWITSNGALPAFTQVASTGRHNCALTLGTVVYCWGANGAGQVGAMMGAFDYAAVPLRVAGLPAVKQVVAGMFHSCALSEFGKVWCWGSGNGTGATGDYRLGLGDVRAVQPALDFTRLGGGGWRAQCALDFDQRAWCWGFNGDFELGRGTPGADAHAPDSAARPVASPRRYVDIATGDRMTCAVTTTGGADCWGSGLLGDGGTTASDSLPHAVAVPGSPRLVSISVEKAAACALDDAGRAWCWGSLGRYGLGDGTSGERASPVQVGGALRFAVIDVGATHACGVSKDGYVYCWGENAQGQLGTDSFLNTFAPERVAYQK